jgi:CHAT domain-containing protein
LPDAWQESAQALHKWLITPIQEHLPPADSDSPPRLGIIPHDLLHYLPFGLLYDGENTLLDGYTLFYGPSVSSLRFIFEKRHPDADTLLAFANPDAPGAPHLHYAVEEAQAVATLYGTQPFIGSDATEGRFKAQAGEYGVVHVAAHSDYNPQSPLFSAILLQTGEDEDGRLETHEVFNLHLPQADLVVLSACETHLGELGAGDELVGLERAFVRAGSPSLLSTLWPVDDAATAALMERFYTHLRAGVPKAEALRLAQIETRAEHPEPYYWAGFVLVGDVGARPAAQPSRWIWEWGAVIALLLAVGVVGWQIRRRKRHK